MPRRIQSANPQGELVPPPIDTAKASCTATLDFHKDQAWLLRLEDLRRAFHQEVFACPLAAEPFLERVRLLQRGVGAKNRVFQSSLVSDMQLHTETTVPRCLKAIGELTASARREMRIALDKRGRVRDRKKAWCEVVRCNRTIAAYVDELCPRLDLALRMLRELKKASARMDLLNRAIQEAGPEGDPSQRHVLIGEAGWRQDLCRRIRRARHYPSSLRRAAKRCEQLYAQYVELRRQVAEQHKWLPNAIAKKYVRPGVAFEDLVQEGQVGLLAAVDRFDLRRNVLFRTYARVWVQRAIRLAANQRGLIRVPPNMRDAAVAFLTEQQWRHGCQAGEHETPTASATGSPSRALVDAVHALGEMDSLTSPRGAEDDGRRARDDIVDWRARAVSAGLTEADLKDLVFGMLSSLTPRQREAVELRYGFRGAPKTHEAAGKLMCLTPQRVQQLEAGAFERIEKYLKARPAFKGMPLREIGAVLLGG